MAKKFTQAMDGPLAKSGIIAWLLINFFQKFKEENIDDDTLNEYFLGKNKKLPDDTAKIVWYSYLG